MPVLIPPSQGAFVLVLVLVVVLDSGRPERWSTGVWEYCAKSELHPRGRGLEVLKGAVESRWFRYHVHGMSNKQSAALIGASTRYAVQFGLGAILPHSSTPSLRVAGFEDEAPFGVNLFFASIPGVRTPGSVLLPFGIARRQQVSSDLSITSSIALNSIATDIFLLY